MDVALLGLVGLIALALAFDYTNGFHDAANSIATVVATHVLRPRWAVAWAAAWNVVAFAVVGTAVADTVGQTVRTPDLGPAVVFAALLGAIVWNLASWVLGFPTSSSHALVGGLVGAGLCAGGWSAIRGASVERTALFIVVSPVAGLVLGAGVLGLLRLLLRRADVGRAERRFRVVQLASSAAVSVAHGGNDAQKTMGVIAALLVSTGHLRAGPDGGLPVPWWVVAAAYTAIAAGTLSGGWRIVRTMGTSITHLRPVSGFAAETAAAIAIFGSTALGAPVSTTHTVAGAITGAGAVNRGSVVHWRVFGRLAIAWLVTLPASAGIAALAYLLTTAPPTAVSTVVLGLLLTGLAGAVVVAVRRSPGAGTAADGCGVPGCAAAPGGSDGTEHVPMRSGAGSVLPASGARRRPDPTAPRLAAAEPL